MSWFFIGRAVTCSKCQNSKKYHKTLVTSPQGKIPLGSYLDFSLFYLLLYSQKQKHWCSLIPTSPIQSFAGAQVLL